MEIVLCVYYCWFSDIYSKSVQCIKVSVSENVMAFSAVWSFYSFYMFLWSVLGNKDWSIGKST
ncbi:hypothetical protein RchiOBHm_Chr6g0285751 [Rosa chinensis]|uniref:Uncharacterized protein n=1 Tax=Rosa chinensis TaxID=74649 RepID=A0A2P6PUN5_ROSCH|nr:hypothetical protein RchiOBHm_Chr6g0285751 [Rosa chinensis]